MKAYHERDDRVDLAELDMDAPLELASIWAECTRVSSVRSSGVLEVCPRRRWYLTRATAIPRFFRLRHASNRGGTSAGGVVNGAGRARIQGSELCAALVTRRCCFLRRPSLPSPIEAGPSSASSRLSSSLFSRRTARRSPDGVHLQQRLRLDHRYIVSRPPKRRLRHGVARGRARVGRAARDQARRARRAVPEPRAVDDAPSRTRTSCGCATVSTNERPPWLHLAWTSCRARCARCRRGSCSSSAASRRCSSRSRCGSCSRRSGTSTTPASPTATWARQRALRPAHAQAAALRLRLLKRSVSGKPNIFYICALFYRAPELLSAPPSTRSPSTCGRSDASSPRCCWASRCSPTRRRLSAAARGARAQFWRTWRTWRNSGAIPRSSLTARLPTGAQGRLADHGDSRRCASTTAPPTCRRPRTRGRALPEGTEPDAPAVVGELCC